MNPFYRTLLTAALVLSVSGCGGGSGGGVMDKVLQDFGIRDRPEGYESGSDKVFSQLNHIGRADLDRLNTLNRAGEVKFEEGADGFGKFYRELKIYEDFHPLDARSAPRSGGDRSSGYIGLIEYSYRIHQSLRKNTRVEAQVEPASIATNITGRESIRYRFDRAGNLVGESGEVVDR